jgi:hypothetical protein
VSLIELGNTEVEDLHEGSPVARADDEVLGLEVPVNDSGFVGRLDAFARLEHQLRELARAHGSLALETLVERLAVDKFHEQVRLAAVESAGVERLGNVCAADSRSRGGLAQKPLEHAWIGCRARVEHLERASMFGQLVLDFIDDPHPARSDHPPHAQLARDDGSRRQNANRVRGRQRAASASVHAPNVASIG